MLRVMGNPHFGSKAASGLCQPLIALMPPHSVYIETHLGGGAIMKRKPAALRNIGIDLDAGALRAFACGYPVERVNACCHGYLAGFAFDGSELVYSDPPYLRGTRKSGRRYRHDYEDADTRRCWRCSRSCRARRWCRATRRRCTTSGCAAGAACRCR